MFRGKWTMCSCCQEVRRTFCIFCQIRLTFLSLINWSSCAQCFRSSREALIIQQTKFQFKIQEVFSSEMSENNMFWTFQKKGQPHKAHVHKYLAGKFHSFQSSSRNFWLNGSHSEIQQFSDFLETFKLSLSFDFASKVLVS